ncbi:MAG: hypothetical protein C0520_13470 [Sphingopyxis sp.]|nr:hypothetical protein [Sphingopyxis sp.]
MKKRYLFAWTLAGFAAAAAQPASASFEPAGGLGVTGLEQAVAEFDSLCLAIHPNPKRFDYAVAKSGFGYEKADDDRWRSSRTVVTRVAPGQCDFDAALSAGDSDRDKIAAAVEKGLRKALGLHPVRVVYDGGMRWEWQVDGKTHSVSYYFGPTVPERQLALTYRVGA